VPGIDKDKAMQLKLKGVRTAEELAALDDAACNAVGMGTLTFRKIARLLLQTKKLEAEAEMPRRGRPPKTDAEPVTTGA
jgi:predicted RecB family nuclease